MNAKTEKEATIEQTRAETDLDKIMEQLRKVAIEDHGISEERAQAFAERIYDIIQNPKEFENLRTAHNAMGEINRKLGNMDFRDLITTIIFKGDKIDEQGMEAAKALIHNGMEKY